MDLARSLIDAFTIHLSKGSRQVALSQIARSTSAVSHEVSASLPNVLHKDAKLAVSLGNVFTSSTPKRLYLHIHSTESAEGMVDICVAPPLDQLHH